MPHGLLEVLRYFLIALLWLFFLYAARMVIVDVRRSRPSGPGRGPGSGEGEVRAPAHLRIIEPRDQRGRQFSLDKELTLGRSAACVIVLDEDTFASSVHARVFHRDDDIWLEDLGSTNGTFINEERLAAPVRLRRGDRVKVGNTVLEVRR